MHGTMTGKIFEAYLVERRLAPARRSPSPCSTSNYSQGPSREHAASLPCNLASAASSPKGSPASTGGNLIAQGLVPLYIDADVHDRLEVGDRLAIRGLKGRGHKQRGRGRDPDREERAVPSPARPLPRERRVLIADSVLNQLSTERTHHDGSALTPKPRTPAAQSPDVGNRVLGWDLTFADVQPVRSGTGSRRRDALRLRSCCARRRGLWWLRSGRAPADHIGVSQRMGCSRQSPARRWGAP